MNPFAPAVAPTVVKSPINMLYEVYPNVVFKCTFGDGTPVDSEPGDLILIYHFLDPFALNIRWEHSYLSCYNDNTLLIKY